MKQIKDLEQQSRQLEPGHTERNEWAAQALAYADHFVTTLPSQPGLKGGSLSQLKTLALAEEGKPFDQLLALLKNEVDAIGINSASGRHLGYIPGGGLWMSAMADMLTAVSNRYAGIAYSSPGAVEIENQMIRWLCSLVGYPATAHGNLTSGGSIANLIAIKAARDLHGIHSGNVKQAVIYFSEQAHHCIQKAFHITGLYEAVLRPIPLNDHYQMDHQALQQQLEADTAAGLNPFLVIATAGTTDTGAIDPLEAIAALCRRYHAWFHVDAAYGGFFMLVDEIRERLKGIEQADSLVMDPHKTLFMPYGSGVVLLKNREALLASNAHKAGYMQDAYGLDEIDPADTGPELSRHFRGMRMWLPLHIHGLAAFRAALAEKILLCRYFHEQVELLGFETGAAPALSVAIFRYADDPDNSINEQLIQALHEDGRVFFSSTLINGKHWIRCAVVHFRTHLEEINLALRMLRETITAVRSKV